MSDSAETPGSSPPPPPDNESSSPPPDNDSSSPPSPAVQDSSPPQDGGSAGNSSSTPSPSDQGGSSPPSPSSSSTPPPNSSSPSPPTASPPPPSSSSSSSEAPQSSPTSPPPPPPHSPPPPSPSQQQTPPPSGKSPSPPPPQSPPPSATPVGGTTPSPPPPTELRPPPPLSASNAPPNPSNNVTASTSNGTSSSSTHSPSSSGGSSSGSSTSGGTGSKVSRSPSRNDTDGGGGASTTTKAVVGVVVSVVLLMVIALFFIVRRRRGKKRNSLFPPHSAPPNNFTVKTDGYYGPQHQSMGSPGPPNQSYGSQPQHSPLGNSYGSPGMFNGGGLDSGLLGGSKTYFSYEEVTEMTSGFAKENIIGEGGFGYVYKGRLPDRRVVAVKQLKAGSGQGDREFKAEVEIISRVHHKHLVSLVGYCISDRQRMLIYEFVPNKTLEHHLHAKEMPVLDWEKRMKIAIGSAKGLAYLHDDCNPKIIHRDIKSANILLDDAFEAQVADFGLARLNDTTQTHVSTRVMGTFGYLAPEYASSGKLTDRSDVYSFGVVLLELITGRKPVDPTQPLGDESLVEWARPLLIHALDTGDIGELVDPRLEKHYVESEMFRMIETAAACVRHSAPKRPRMVQVVRALDSDTQLSDLSNGVKYGQSTIYDSGQYNQEIMRFRRMALGSIDSSDMDYKSGEYTSRDLSRGALTPSSDYTSGESETRVLNPNSGNHRFGGSP